LDENTFDQQFEGGHVMGRRDLLFEQRPQAQALEEMIHQWQGALKFVAQG
jgi:hypothetical protein